MGCTFFFDEVVPRRRSDSEKVQIELADNHGVIELRIGPVGNQGVVEYSQSSDDEDNGQGRYVTQLTVPQARKLADALERVADRLAAASS